MSEQHNNIYEALAAAMGETGYVQKQKASGLNYTFAGEAALIAEIRPALVKHGIVVLPDGVSEFKSELYTTSKGAVMNRVTGLYAFIFAHAGSGTTHRVEVAGEASDSGDKASYKAATGAYKYALRQTLMIETGDDPDKQSSEDQQRVADGFNNHKPVESEFDSAPRWIEDAKLRAGFWAWTKEQGLTHAQVHSILGVTSLKLYADTLGEAKTVINKFLASHASQVLYGAEDESIQESNPIQWGDTDG